MYVSNRSCDRILNYFEIIPLLRPTHPFFEDKQGSIEDFAVYKQDPESEYWFLYPRCKYDHPDNPYRRYRLSQSHAARTVKKVLALKEAYHLDKLKVLTTVLTFDHDLSLWLGQQPGGLDMAWRLFPKFLDVCLAKFQGQPAILAAIATLHFWHTKDPVNFHFHFHFCWLNYLQRLAFDDPEHGQTYEYIERPFPINEDGKRLPFTKAELAQMRAIWKRIQANFAHRHGVDCPALKGDGEVDIEVKYIGLNTEKGRASFAHRLKYLTRPPIVDYAKASNKNPNYPPPTERILKYTTRARTFGYWKHFKTLIGELPQSDICKPHPETSKPMEYVGRVSLDGVLDHAAGQLGRLDFRKGKPIFGILTEKDIDKLRSYDYYAYPNTGWYKNNRGDLGALLAPRAPP